MKPGNMGILGAVGNTDRLHTASIEPLSAILKLSFSMLPLKA
jgi:hypothetical protein